MIEERCIGPDVDRARISPEAVVSGTSYLTGRRTTVAPGGVVRDSRLHDAAVEAGAEVVDSIVVAEGTPRLHKCDAAGRTVVSGANRPRVGAGACVRGSTLINAAVGERTTVTDTWARDCRLGPDNAVERAKIDLSETGGGVRIIGPTEVSEAWVGHGATIDRRGYFEGIFSNSFHQIRFDEASGRLEVAGTIDLPHVSLYGTNTINSTNSGKLLPQPEEGLRSLGPPVGLWHDSLLSHEQIELGPCCWVVPWTKVVGQSAEAHAGAEERVNDDLLTWVMPFGVAGFGGELTRGLVMPGELSTGFGPKQREGAWAFTYAPDAVIRMVRRLHEALEPGRKDLADTIVVEALRTAVEMTRAMAARRRVDLSVPHTEQRPGWPRWIGRTFALLTAHLEGGLWEFSGGEPTGWKRESGRRVHPAMGRVLEIAPDALERQVSDEGLFRFEDPVPPVSVAMPSGAVAGTGGEADVDPDARVAADATVGPGCRIGPGCVVEPGATVWNSVLEGSTVGAGARVERCVLRDSSVGAGATLRSTRMAGAGLGDGSTADAAALSAARLAAGTTVSPFADVADVECAHAAIIGGAFHSARVGCHLMTMHMAGGCSHLRAVPVVVTLDGEEVAVPAPPMLGGGSLIRGTAEQPVEMECCFIGSNAIIEAGTYVGFGCFVLGRLGPDAGLPPFTMSFGPDPARQQIGAALASLPSVVITHFIGWTYQAVGAALAPAVAEMTRQAIREGIGAVEWELSRREGGEAPGSDPLYARYRSLKDYGEEQLRRGLEDYRAALESGAWELAFRDGELRFVSGRGHWAERGRSALWLPTERV